MVKARIVKKNSIVDTFLSIPEKETVEISVKDCKISYARNTASRLKKRGFLYTISEQGVYDKFFVTRLK